MKQFFAFRVPRMPHAVLYILLIGVLVLLPASASWAADGPTATVTVAALNLRQGPGTNYPIIDVLQSGGSGVVIGRDAAGTWYQVSLAGGRTGWVYGDFVQLSGDASKLPVVAAAAAPVSAAAPATSGDTIVFQLSSGGAIYAMKSDGSNLRYLTAGIDPAISPNGRVVAFTRWSNSGTGSLGDLWVIGVDGSGERKVVGDTSQPKSPVWSADGKAIVVNIQKGKIIDPRRCLPDDFSPPPDAEEVTHVGSSICFRAVRPLWQLRSVDVASGAFKDLPGDTLAFAPTLDPVNSWRVVYVGDRGLVNLDMNLGNNWPLTDDPADRSPVFSPAGNKIAVSYRQTDHWEVHTLNADGTGRARITQTPMTVLIDQQLKGQTARSWDNAAPAWSPDGTRIAFLTNRSGAWEIWVMNADGSNQKPLLTASALGGQQIQYNGVDERVISWR